MINSRGFLLPISSPQKSLPLKKSFPHLFFPEFLYFPKASASNWLEKRIAHHQENCLKETFSMLACESEIKKTSAAISICNQSQYLCHLFGAVLNI